MRATICIVHLAVHGGKWEYTYQYWMATAIYQIIVLGFNHVHSTVRIKKYCIKNIHIS